MPGVLLDDGTWKSIVIPSVTTIGRASGSDIQPESQSISKKHASLSLRLDHRGKLKCELTDFDSRNGTFYGPSPYDREMKRVAGTQLIEYGTYLKFGNSNTYFHFVENQPVGTPLAYEGPHGPAGSVTAGIGKVDVRNSNSSSFRIGGEEGKGGGGEGDEGNKFPLPNTASDNSLVHSTELLLQPAQAQRRPQPTMSGDPDNMMISIQYPTGQTKPVSIHIDPQGYGPPEGNNNRNSYESNSNRGSRDSYGSNHSNDHHRYGGSHGGGNEQGGYNNRSNDHDGAGNRNGIGKSGVRGSLGTDQAWEDVRLDRNDGGVSPANSQPGGLGRGVKRYNSQVDNSVDDDDENGLPPMLGDAITGEIDENIAPNLALFRSNAGNYHEQDYHHTDPGGTSNSAHPRGHHPKPMSPIHGSHTFTYPGQPIVDEKPDALLVRRVWLDMSVLGVTHTTSRVVAELVENQVHEGYTEESPVPSVDDLEGELPEYVKAEAAADRFLDGEDTICGRLGGAISELNDLLNQAMIGAQINTPRASVDGSQDPVGQTINSELDVALMSIVNEMLVSSINSIHECIKNHLVQALAAADEDGCHNDVKVLLTNACGRLERLLGFFNKTWMTKLAEKARSSEFYSIAAFTLHCVLSELDIANALLYSICQDCEEEAHLKDKKKKKGKGKDGHSKSLNLEIDELRRLKAKSKAKGGNPAIAAQIAMLEKSTRAGGFAGDGDSLEMADIFAPSGLPGEQNQRYTDMELKRVRDQEAAAKVPARHMLKALRVLDNNLLKFQNWLFRRWKNTVKDMKMGYLKKLDRFGRILSNFGHRGLTAVFRRWEKNTIITRAEQQQDQIKAELRYEMCGMAYKIHELTSENTLAASLAAERALNFELNELNMHLRKSVTELDTKLLECANAPPSKRKMLVRDVLFGREDEVSHARREAKSLRDELQLLYDLGIKVPEKAIDKVLPKAPVPNTYGRPKDPNEILPPKDGKAKFGAPESNKQQGRSTSPLHDSLQHTRPLAHKEINQSYLGELSVDNPNRPIVSGRNRMIAPVSGKFLDRDNREMTNGLSKKDAAIIIAKEVGRLSHTLQNSEKMKDIYSKRLVHDATKHMQQRLALQALQRRITDRERSLTALRQLLKMRLGDKGLMEFTVALEDMGVGNSALLRDPTSLDDPSNKEYSNVPPIEPFRFGPPPSADGSTTGAAGAGDGGNDASGLPNPVNVTKQRESYKDTIDDALEHESDEKKAAAEEAKKAVLQESVKKTEVLNAQVNENMLNKQNSTGKVKMQAR